MHDVSTTNTYCQGKHFKTKVSGSVKFIFNKVRGSRLLVHLFLTEVQN